MTIPWRVSTFSPWPPTAWGGPPGEQAIYDHNSGLITTHRIDRVGILRPGLYYTQQWTLYGVQVGGTVTDEITIGSRLFMQSDHGYRNFNAYITADGPSISDGASLYWSTVAPDGQATLTGPVVNADYWYISNGSNGGCCVGGYLFGPTDGGALGYPGKTVITGWPSSPLGHARHLVFPLDQTYSLSLVNVGPSNDGFLYVLADPTTIPGQRKMWKLTTDLELVHFWSLADLLGSDVTSCGGNFFVFNDLICYTGRNLPTHVDGQTYVKLVKIHPDYTLQNWGTPLLSTAGLGAYFCISLGGCYGIEYGGVFSLCDSQPRIWTSEGWISDDGGGGGGVGGGGGGGPGGGGTDPTVAPNNWPNDVQPVMWGFERRTGVTGGMPEIEDCPPADPRKVTCVPIVIPSGPFVQPAFLSPSVSSYGSPQTFKQAIISRVPGDFAHSLAFSQGNTATPSVRVGVQVMPGETVYFCWRYWSPDLNAPSCGTEPQGVSYGGGWPP